MRYKVPLLFVCSFVYLTSLFLNTFLLWSSSISQGVATLIWRCHCSYQVPPLPSHPRKVTCTQKLIFSPLGILYCQKFWAWNRTENRTAHISSTDYRKTKSTIFLRSQFISLHFFTILFKHTHTHTHTHTHNNNNNNNNNKQQQQQNNNNNNNNKNA